MAWLRKIWESPCSRERMLEEDAQMIKMYTDWRRCDVKIFRCICRRVHVVVSREERPCCVIARRRHGGVCDRGKFRQTHSVRKC